MIFKKCQTDFSVTYYLWNSHDTNILKSTSSRFNLSFLLGQSNTITDCHRSRTQLNEAVELVVLGFFFDVDEGDDEVLLQADVFEKLDGVGGDGGVELVVVVQACQMFTSAELQISMELVELLERVGAVDAGSCVALGDDALSEVVVVDDEEVAVVVVGRHRLQRGQHFVSSLQIKNSLSLVIKRSLMHESFLDNEIHTLKNRENTY